MPVIVVMLLSQDFEPEIFLTLKCWIIISSSFWINLSKNKSKFTSSKVKSKARKLWISSRNGQENWKITQWIADFSTRLVGTMLFKRGNIYQVLGLGYRILLALT
jgi:hypothetical protein